MTLRIFTDGACSGNPGVGGWASLYAFSNHMETISGGEVTTTNNKMELLAVVKSLEMFIDKFYNPSIKSIEVNSDSAYVVNSINQNWLDLWKKNGWKTTNGKGSVKNHDLWVRLLKVLSDLEWLSIKVTFVKVKGHSGNELNELVDGMARKEVEKLK